MENRRQVLDMLAQGKITADEAERLLSLVDQPAGAEPRGAETSEARKPVPKYLRVVVGDGNDPQSEHVNIRVPMGLIRAGVKLAALLPDKWHRPTEEVSWNSVLGKNKPQAPVPPLPLDPIVPFQGGGHLLEILWRVHRCRSITDRINSRSRRWIHILG